MSERNGHATVPEQAQRYTLYSREAEIAVLGCMLSQPADVMAQVESLAAEDFFIPAHQELFDAMRGMWNNEVAIEVRTLHQWLTDRGQAEEVGSPGVLADLLGGFANHLNVGTYVRIVREKSTLRSLERYAQRVAKDLIEMPDSVASVLDRAEFGLKQVFDNANGLRKASDFVSFDWLDFHEHQEKQPDPPQLIRGLLHLGSKLVLGGSSKSNKTWSLLDLAISVATGNPWWGMNCDQGAVLYCDMELHRKFLHNRVKAVLSARGIQPTRGDLFFMPLRGHVSTAERTLSQIQKHCPKGIKLIVIDPVYKFNAGKDENSAGEIGAMLNLLEQFSTATGAAIVYAAHYSKGNQAGKESIDRISGSGVYARDADSLVMMTKHEEEDCFTVECTLRNFIPTESFVVRWSYPLMQRDDDLDPLKLKKPPGSFETKFELGQLTDLIAGRTMTTGEIEKECKAKLGMSDSTVKRLLKLAEKKGRATKLSVGLWQGVTP